MPCTRPRAFPSMQELWPIWASCLHLPAWVPSVCLSAPSCVTFIAHPMCAGPWAVNMLDRCPCPYSADLPWRKPTVKEMPQRVANWEESKTVLWRLGAGLSNRCPELPLKEELSGKRAQQKSQASAVQGLDGRPVCLEQGG